MVKERCGAKKGMTGKIVYITGNPLPYGVEYIVDACSFQDAKATHRKAIWCAPDFDIWPVAK